MRNAELKWEVVRRATLTVTFRTPHSAFRIGRVPDRPPLPRRQALGPRAHLGKDQPLCREDPAHRARARPVAAVSQQEGRVDLRAVRGDRAAHPAGGDPDRAAAAGRGDVSHHAQDHTPVRGRADDRPARGLDARDRRRSAAQGPLREGVSADHRAAGGKRDPAAAAHQARAQTPGPRGGATSHGLRDGHGERPERRRVDCHYRAFERNRRALHRRALPHKSEIRRTEDVGWHRRGHQSRATVRKGTGAHHLRRYAVRRRLVAHADELEKAPGRGGEYDLTDAFQYMVDRGRRLYTAPVGGWYDCGKVETLLETNRHLLEQGRARIPQGPCPRCTIVPPVYIEDGVTIHDATVGPNVSLEAGSFVTESAIANAIVGRNVRVVRSAVRDSLVGDDQVIEGKTIERSVLDGGALAPA